MQLLEDIDEQSDSSSSEHFEYFIGTILVSPRVREGHVTRGHYDVIDGQQRLTTSFLILCALKVLFSGTAQGQLIERLTVADDTDLRGKIVKTLKLEPKYENAGVIKKIVETNGDPRAVRSNIQNAGIKIYGSVENILNAYDLIYCFLTDHYTDKAQLQKYWGRLANNVVFIQISTDVSSALKIFETINERGVGLNPMDLLKNLLFTQVSQDQFSLLKDEWKKITSPLERNKEKPLRFLRYFLMANYEIKNERKDAIVREDQIYDWFLKKNNAELTGYQKTPFVFVEQITLNVNRYISFINGCGNDGKPSFAMDSLKKLTGAAFSLHYVLLLAAANLPKPLFDQFVAQLENFLFFYIFTTTTKDLDRNFSFWADEVRDIAHRGNPAEQRQKLNEFVSERFAKNMSQKTPELKDVLKRLTLDSILKYRMRYLLARLTQYVDMAFKGEKVRGSLDPYFKLDIEHILPNNPNEKILNTWKEKHPELIYDEHKNRLGNLTLLEASINKVASNGSYEDKVRKYAKSGHYLTRSLSALAEVGQNTSISRINEKLSAYKKWDAQAIDDRQSRLIALAQEVWKTTTITG